MAKLLGDALEKSKRDSEDCEYQSVTLKPDLSVAVMLEIFMAITNKSASDIVSSFLDSTIATIILSNEKNGKVLVELLQKNINLINTSNIMKFLIEKNIFKKEDSKNYDYIDPEGNNRALFNDINDLTIDDAKIAEIEKDNEIREEKIENNQ